MTIARVARSVAANEAFDKDQRYYDDRRLNQMKDE